MEDWKELQRQAYQNKVDHGFNVTDVPMEFCLLYGEVGEAYQAWSRQKPDLGEELAQKLEDTCLRLFEKCYDYAYERGIIIADTKFEFGVLDGRTILGDEVLTPDSSRFWSADDYEVGREQASFDKQFVRNWLNANWDRQGNPPHLPADVIEKTTEKYIQAYEKLSGRTFNF